MGGSIGFIMRGWEIFKVSLYSWKRGANHAILWRPSILPTPFFSTPSPTYILSTPSRTFLSPPAPTSTALSVIMFLWLNRWSCHICCTILLNGNMDLYMSKLGTLVPTGSWCGFCATRRQSYEGDRQCGFLLVLWLDLTHKQTLRHTEHTQGPED